MKKIFVLMLGLVAGTASFAQEVAPQPTTPQTRVAMTADQKIKLFVGPLPATAHIVFQDASGHALFTENVKLTHGFGQQFDVSGLAVGTYRLTLTTDGQTVVKTFVVQPVPYQTFMVAEA